MLSKEEFNECITSLNVLAGRCYHLDKAIDRITASDFNWNNVTIKSSGVNELLDEISGLEACITRAKGNLLKLKDDNTSVQTTESLSSIRNRMKKLAGA